MRAGDGRDLDPDLKVNHISVAVEGATAEREGKKNPDH